MSIIHCENLTKRYSNKTVALNHVSFDCQEGRIIGLLGPNGSGKTTFIKLVQKLLTPTEGTIEIDGMKPGVETKKIVSYLPDIDFYNDNMKVKEILAFYQDFFEDFKMEKATAMLEQLHVDLEQKIKFLSKGNREKVQLALCMSREAKLYLLDEPIGGVDPATRDYILHTILSNFDNSHSTLMISTHLITDIENILDDVIFINEGQIVAQTSVDQIRTEHEMSVNDYFKEVFKCY